MQGTLYLPKKKLKIFERLTFYGRPIYLITSLCFFLPLFLGCASTTQTLKAKYKVKDHFRVGKYEVGVLEYEDAILGTFMRLYSFPIYTNGKRIKTFYLDSHELSEVEIQKIAKEEIKRGKIARVDALGEWVLVPTVKGWTLWEETQEGKRRELKNFPEDIIYEAVKMEVIKILEANQ